MTSLVSRSALGGLLGLSLALGGCTAIPGPASAQTDSLAVQPTYADLATWIDSSDLVLRAQIRKQTEVPPERATGLAPGMVRLYIQAETQALLTGRTQIGEEIAYLVDVPRRANGKAPKLKKNLVLLFARAVPGRANEIQLVTSSAQLPATADLELRVRPILQEFASAQKPPVVTGVRDALPVFGNLVGESESQFFLRTQSDQPASMTVIRRPGQPARWGVSWSELVDQSATAPAPQSIEWYRLACALPQRLPGGAVLADSLDLRQLAEQDYAFIREQLGPCDRKLS